MVEQLRLFVAIELPGEVRDALSRLQHELQRRGLEKLRWVRPEGIHLTLKFLGETPVERVSAIKDALDETVRGVQTQELSLGTMGTFGGPGNPRVFWVDLLGDLKPLLALQRSVDDALAKIGFPREGRAFSPHLTLARVRPETAREVAAAITEALNNSPPPSAMIPVREVSLMRSTLRPSGAVYERLAAFPLAEA